jgi:hypothetical protein
MDYIVNLGVHNTTRWLILGAGLWALGRSCHGFVVGRPWARRDQLAGLLLTTLLNLQFMLGLALYLRSPVVRPWFSAADYLTSSPAAVFFALAHPLAMVTAVVLAQATYSFAKRAPDDRRKFRRAVVGYFLTAALILVAVPWPFLAYGRPLVPSFGG